MRGGPPACSAEMGVWKQLVVFVRHGAIRVKLWHEVCLSERLLFYLFLQLFCFFEARWAKLV